MKKQNKKNFYISVFLLAAFVLWTVAVCIVDVDAIGPQNSAVGFSTINKFISEHIGVHMSLYNITDWLGLVPIFFAFGFAVLGLAQWIKRKNILKVDYSILTLGGFYFLTIAAYIFFEMFVINYRPILINGYLEVSYPSSTTLLVLCIIPTAIMQFRTRIKNNFFKNFVSFLLTAFIVFMVLGRLISGVHWFTDIIGGALLSSGLVLMYRAVVSWEIK